MAAENFCGPRAQSCFAVAAECEMTARFYRRNAKAALKTAIKFALPEVYAKIPKWGAARLMCAFRARNGIPNQALTIL